MRYAVITDVHANLYALKAFFEDIKGRNIDKIICLGDIVGNGVYPEECVQLLRRQKDIVFVKGNHDMFVLLDLDTVKNGDPRVDMFRFQQRILSKASKEFLSKLKDFEVIEDDGVKICCMHYPKNRSGRFKDLIYLPSENEVQTLFDGIDGDVFLFGHEHTGSMHEIDGKLYLNFGTLGNFLYKDKCVYGILEINGGSKSYEKIEVDYDDDKAREKTKQIISIIYEGKENPYKDL